MYVDVNTNVVYCVLVLALQCRWSGQSKDRGDGENAKGGAVGESQTY